MLNAAETSHIIKYEGILIVGGHMTLFHFVKGTGTANVNTILDVGAEYP